MTGQIVGGTAGGLTSVNNGEIISCRAKLSVKGDKEEFAGGLAGANTNRITMSSAVQTSVGASLQAVWPSSLAVNFPLVCHRNSQSRVRRRSCGRMADSAAGAGKLNFNCYSRSVLYDHEEGTDPPNMSWMAGLVIGTVGPGAMTNCYAAGAIVCRAITPFLGGLIADVSGSETVEEGEPDLVHTYSCYWDREISSVFTSQGGSGRTTREMTYPYAAGAYLNWDFNETWAHDPTFSKNGGYPWLPKASEEILPEVSLRGNQLIEVGGRLALEISMSGIRPYSLLV